jgi:WD40 repeat protein
LELAAGDPATAQETFKHVARTVSDGTARAEAYFNAYQAALERHDWESAFRELLEAVKLDPRRFAPFPVGKYHPKCILGAGGFGVAFLCRDKDLDADVVVKALRDDGLGGHVEEVLKEAQLVHRLEHDCVVRVLHCGYSLPKEKARPYFVMSYFAGKTLQEQVQEQPLSVEDCLAVARLMAEGLRAAHARGILHRDVKPANVLVRRDQSGWQVKLIDFGLALAVEAERNTAKDFQTRDQPPRGPVAGTWDYAAPEQMGRLPDTPVAAYSDVYGLAKTCCYALFQTTQPLPQHWDRIPAPLKKLLGECLEENPAGRPSDCAVVIERLDKLGPEGRAEEAEPGLLQRGAKALRRIFTRPDPGMPPAGTDAKEKTPGDTQGDLKPGEPPVATSKDFQAHKGPVLSVAFAPDGTRLLSAGADGTVRLWDLAGKELHRLQPSAWFKKPAAVVHASFTPDGCRAFSVAADGAVRLWNLKTGREVRHFAVAGGVAAAALTADRRRLLVGVARSVTLWDVEQGACVLWAGEESDQPTDIRCVAFTPGGNMLVGGLDGIARLYNGKDGKELRRLLGHTGGVYAIAAFPSGQYAVTGGGDHRLFMWDLERGGRGELAGHTGEVFCVALSPTGRLVLSGGADQTLRVWLPRERKELVCFRGHTDQVRCVAFSPSGEEMVSGSDDGAIRLSRVSL